MAHTSERTMAERRTILNLLLTASGPVSITHLTEVTGLPRARVVLGLNHLVERMQAVRHDVPGHYLAVRERKPKVKYEGTE